MANGRTEQIKLLCGRSCHDRFAEGKLKPWGTGLSRDVEFDGEWTGHSLVIAAAHRIQSLFAA